MEAIATARYELIRHKNAERALEILQFTNKAGATFLAKLLRSALANANQKPEVNVDKLYIKTILVGNGPIRYWARYRGRLHVNRIRRRRCHITIVLDDGAE
jgi:large subunit ribosomal protein L22